jgi:hypothetical protein
MSYLPLISSLVVLALPISQKWYKPNGTNVKPIIAPKMVVIQQGKLMIICSPPMIFGY